MKMRFARAITLASATGLLMSGGVAVAADSTPDTTPAVDIGWAAGTPAPFGGTRFDGALVGKKVYFLGFRTQDNNTDGSIWYYNTEKKKYVDTGIDMAVPVTNYTIAALKDNTGLGLYTFGGRDALGETTTTVQVFYPSTGNTKVIDSDPWPGKTPSDCTSLPATGVTVVDNKAYALGGMSFSTSVPPCADDTSKQVWRYDPKASSGNRWKAQPSLKVSLGYISPAVVNGKIYAIGGDTNEAGTLFAQSTVQAWKVGARKWNDTNYADLPTACDETQAFAFDSGPLGGTITLAGCGQWPNALPDVQQYKVSGDSWSNVGALNEARRNHAGANIGTSSAPKLFVLGGYDATGANVLMTSEVGKPAAAQSPWAPPAAPLPTSGGMSAF